MAKRRKSITDNWQTEQDPVWITEESILRPSSFFLKWWQDVAELQYSDRERWIDIAVNLGYVAKLVDSASGRIYYEPVGFEYDRELIRNTLGIPEEMPLTYLEEGGQERYSHMWDVLLNTKGQASER